MKTLIVVSGGDAPGINAVISQYTALASQQGDTVVGAKGGFRGVLAQDIHQIDLSLVRLLAGKGGTILPSSREPILNTPDARVRLQAIMVKHKIDNILLFGGDGTIRYVLPLLQEWDVPCILLPTTIDNDVAGTEYTLGHDSACNFAFQSIEGVLATAHALPGRIFMVETLGGDTGYLALAIAYSAGARCVLLPEYDVTLDWLGERLKHLIQQDSHALVVLSEGVKLIPELAEAIPRLTGVRLRYTRLGHAQRGGAVSHRDRQLAHEMSQLAYQGFKDNLQIGTIVVQQAKPRLQEGILSGEAHPPPDYDRYAYINQL